VVHLAFAYRMTGEQKYADRARKEMLAAAAFTDWNPSHFLDVAEMTAALAIGYDWLHAKLDAETRATIRTAIVEKGLKIFKGLRGTNNWNQVCNGGMTLGALSVCEDEPELAQKIVARGVADVPNAMNQYAPDGNYPEGPGYWGYGTTYNIVLIAALESALGTDFGLTDAPGFLATPDYYLHATGPTGLFFNYSDCGSSGGPQPAMYWFAARRKDPWLLWTEQQNLTRMLSKAGTKDGWRNDRFFPLLLVWATPGQEVKQPPALQWIGHGPTPVAMFRSAWDESAVYVGFKGGSPSASHAHMDIGEFVMDGGGVRWAEDLGAQDYHSLESKGVNMWDGKQEGERWAVFRIGPMCHNILTVDGNRQVVKGKAPLIESGANFAVADTSAVYAGQLAKAVRRVELRPDRSVTVRDDIEGADAAVTVRWGMVTRANVTIGNDGSALLERDGKKLTFRVVSPAAVTLKTYQTDPAPRETDARNEGTRMLGFEVALPAAGKQRLEVVLTPGL
jgi:hypothetical protein